MPPKLNDTSGNPATSETRKRRREWLIALAIVTLCGVLFRYQGQIFDLTSEVPLSGNILVLALININILLIILCLFLVFRNVFKLLLERRRDLPGARLRSKLVLAFVTLSLVPTMLLFFVSAGFITNSIENWFNTQIEDSLRESLEVAQTYYKNSASNALYYADQISLIIKDQKLLNEENLLTLEQMIHQKQKEYNLGIVEVFSSTLEELVRAVNPQVPAAEFTDPGSDNIHEALQGNRFTRISPIGRADLIRGIVPVYSNWNPDDVVGVVVVNYYVPYSLVNKMNEISNSFDQFKSTKLLKGKIQKGYVLFLLLIALVIIFLATWAGFYLARGITGPIQDLAEATNRVSTGDLEVTIDSHSNDEVGSLIIAFNKMTADLRQGQREIHHANQELQSSNLELEQRRRYMEIVLANVTAGVISIDSQGRLTTINKSAAKLLRLSPEKIVGRNFRDVIPAAYQPMVKDILKDLMNSGKNTLRRQVTLPLADGKLTLLINISTLKDESGEFMGTVVVFDDLTQLLKVQRMAAWREVARRIAHEIKNPLTPIQLSAQRLRRRYLDRFTDDSSIFDECTNVIIRQVDDLKNLVNEFSNFARMPTSNPTENNLNEVISEALILFQEGHRDISFSFSPDASLPIFSLDREQVKRVVINLLDNAVAATTSNGQVDIITQFHPELQMAAMSISDNGSGIAPEDKPRLFEPYFSTKKAGTGLGLAIVSTIVADHNGYIRVHDNSPQGTTFTIELPIATALRTS
ncbi:MAG: PAS domain-containing sensor histidine kinase [Desulfuromonas sp.]|nr:MAG: PAS domain-containing sensor histidine kinase [Desulfuromonas sp.]